MKNEVRTASGRPILRVALIAALFLLLFAVFSVAAFAEDQPVTPATITLSGISQPKEGVQNTGTPSLSKNNMEIVAAKIRYRRNGVIKLDNVNDYVPQMADNENEVQLHITVRLNAGWYWQDRDLTLYPMKWNGQTVLGERIGSEPTSKFDVRFVFNTYVAGTVETVKLAIDPPVAGKRSSDTVSSELYDWRVFTLNDSGYPHWKINDGGRYTDPPKVWQGGSKVQASVKIKLKSGCTYKTAPLVEINGVSIPKSDDDIPNHYTISGSFLIAYYTWNVAAELDTSLDLSNGTKSVSGTDSTRYLNTFCKLVGKTPSSGTAAQTHDIDLNADGKNDLVLTYTPRTASFPAILQIKPDVGLYLALGKKTQKTFSLTETQQLELLDAGFSSFWQKIDLTISRPKVTIDPNGGAFKNGSTSPAVFTVNASHYITTSAAAAYFDTSDSEKYGLKRDGYYVVGLAKTKDATSSSYTPNSSFFSSTTFTEDTTFYVVWKAYTKLTVDPNGGVFGDGTTVPFTVTLGKDGKVAKSAYLTQQLYNGNGPTREGYHLLGFNTYKDASSAATLDTLTSRTFSSDTTIYLIWHKKHFLTIDPNGGVFPDGSTKPVTLALDKNDRVSNADVMEYCLANTPVFRDGYRLSGFSEVKDGEFKYYPSGLRNTPFSEDKTVYALWTKTVTLTLDPNGGLMQNEMSPAFTDKPYSFKIEVGRNPDLSAMIHYGAFIRDGFEITGFATDAGGVNKVDPETWTAPDKDTTLYAVWAAPNTLKITRQPYVINYASDGSGPLLYGMDATFCCVAAGQDVRYQWQSAEAGSHDETKFTGLTWKDLAGETDYMLTVTASIEDHNGRVYRCIVKDKGGTTLESKIVFAEPTTFRSNPEDFVGEVGETAVFRAELSSPAPTYYWHAKKSGVEMSLASIPGLTGQDTKELRFPITSDLNEVVFYCVVTDGKLGINESTESGKLFVKPSIKNVAVTVPTPSVGTKPSEIPITLSDGVVVEEAHWFRVYDPDEIDALREYGLAKLFNEGEPWRYHCYDMTGKDAPLVAGTYIVSVYFLKDVGGMDPFIAMMTGAYDAFNPAFLNVTVNGVKCRLGYEMAASRANAAAYAVVTVYPPHAHKTEKINEVAATCVKPGTKSYYRCTICGKLFSDAAATKEITAPEAVPATGKHTWNKGEVTKQPTTSTPGLMTYTCLVCGAKKTENIPVLSPDDPPTPPEPAYLLGDIDNDGKVTASDARLALRASVLLEVYEETGRAFKAADVNLDKVITSADARLILRKAVGFDDKEFGVRT